MSVNAKPYQILSQSRINYTVDNSNPIKLNNHSVASYLRPNDITELKRLNKFELFGGRVKQQAIKGLVDHMGPKGVKEYWGLTETEYKQALDSSEGSAFKRMGPDSKNSVLKSKYGFDEYGVERNTTPLAKRFNISTVTTANTTGLKNIDLDRSYDKVQPRLTTPTKSKKLYLDERQRINKSQMSPYNSRSLTPTRLNQGSSILLSRKRTELQNRNEPIPASPGDKPLRYVTPDRKVSPALTPRKDFNPQQNYLSNQRNGDSQKKSLLLSQTPQLFDSYEKRALNSSINKNNASKLTQYEGNNKRYRSVTPSANNRNTDQSSRTPNNVKKTKASILNTYSERLKTPSRTVTPRTVTPQRKTVQNNQMQSQKQIQDIKSSQYVAPFIVPLKNAIETSTVFENNSLSKSRRIGRGGSLSKQKLHENLEFSSLNQTLVTTVQYKPDNSPTNNTFLRNKFGGVGSNEHEVSEMQRKRSQVYFALPKSFYDHPEQEEMMHNGVNTKVRRYSPDFSKSRLADALREADHAENAEVDRLINESTIY